MRHVALGLLVAAASERPVLAAPAGGVAAHTAESTHRSAALGPGKGAGERAVAPPAAGAPSLAGEAKPAAAPPVAEATLRSHKRGRSPKHPSPTLPGDAPRSAADESARRQVAAGPTADDLAVSTADPELLALIAAERVLFPRALPGIRPGFTWDLPEPAASGDVRRRAGLPPSTIEPTAEPLSERATDAEWLESLSMPDLPIRLDPRVVKYLKFYRDDPQGRLIAKVWARKSGRFVPALKGELAKAKLPTDLVWLSLIESGHNPTIVSPAGAAGLWQFIPDSGRLYGLTVDRWVDERLDPQRATEAALAYLSDLHRRFGNWELAMAAYNMGYGGLLRSVRKFNTNDFWRLTQYEAAIPWETSLYVPKIFAIAVVMNNKRAFGIADVAPDPALSFDTVYVDPGVSLGNVARAAGVPAPSILALNPHYLAERTPPQENGKPAHRWPVKVPLGHGIKAGAELAKAGRVSSDQLVRVRFGDTLESIAGAHGTTERKLSALNHFRGGERLRAGAVILVPSGADAPATVTPDASVEPPIAVVPPQRFNYVGRRRVFYDVLSGDTAENVARAFGVAQDELTAWNALDPAAHLQAGQVLQLFLPRDASLDDVRHLAANDVRIMEAGSDQFIAHFEALNGRRRIVVNAKEGETLSIIGSRYGLSSGMMERINHYSRRKTLAAGDTVIVYAKASQVSATTPGVTAEPLPALVAPPPATALTATSTVAVPD